MIKRAGMTLVEIMLAIAVIAVIFAAVSPYFKSILDTAIVVERRTEVLQNGRIALDRMTSELNAAKRIISVTSSSNPDGQIVFIDSQAQEARFLKYLSSGQSMLGYYAGGQTYELAGPIQSLKFTACGADGTAETSVPSLIKSVSIELIVSDEVKKIEPQRFTASVSFNKNLIGGFNYAVFSNSNVLLYGQGAVNGNVHANDQIDHTGSIVVSGSKTSILDGIAIPCPEASFINYTQEADVIHNSSFSFTTSTTGLHYVRGNASFPTDNVVLDGGVVVEGDVIISGNNVVINKTKSYPAILSGGGIRINGADLKIYGLVYSYGDVILNSSMINITGEVISKGVFSVNAGRTAYINYNPEVVFYPPPYFLEGVAFIPPTPPAEVVTVAATDITTNSAALNMTYDFKSYSSGNVRFFYKRRGGGAPWLNTPWEARSGAGAYSYPITGLDDNKWYDFYAQLSYDSTNIDGTTLSFKTLRL